MTNPKQAAFANLLRQAAYRGASIEAHDPRRSVDEFQRLIGEAADEFLNSPAAAAILGEPAPFTPRFQCPKCGGETLATVSTHKNPLCFNCFWSGPRTACGLAPPVTTEPARDEDDDGESELPLPTGERATANNLAWIMSGMPKVARTSVDIHVFDYLRAEVNALQSAAAERERQVTALVAAAQPFAKYMAAIEGWPATGEETLQPRSDTGYVPLKLFIRIKHLREIREALAALTPNATETLQ